MWIQIPRNSSIVHQEIDVSVLSLYDLNDVQQTLSVGNISLNRNDLIKFLLNREKVSMYLHGESSWWIRTIR